MKALAITLAVLAGTVTIAGSGVAQPTQGAALSIADASGPEGDTGTRPLAFPVTLSAANKSDTAVSVSYRTQNETARAGEDYVSAQGELEFARGETTKTIEVQVNGDRAVEPDEFFSLVLFDPIGATIAEPGGTGTGTIQNDDQNVLPQACKCRSVRVRVAGFAAHGSTRLQRRAAEFWDVVFRADLTCRQGDVVDCAGFVRTASSPFITQKPKVFTCRGTKCGATSTHTLKVRVRVPRTEILQRRAAGRPLKKTLKLRAGCRGAPGVMKTFTLVLPKRN
jgi:Calx-beta domain